MVDMYKAFALYIKQLPYSLGISLMHKGFALWVKGLSKIRVSLTVHTGQCIMPNFLLTGKNA